jgi:nitrogenase-associated protein
MATLIFYEKPGCGNNTRQKRMLLDAGHELVVRDLLTEPWTAQRLRDFFKGLPVADWFNRAAPQVKSGEIDPARVEADAALNMMLANPLLIRRPLMECDGKRIAGFDADRIEDWIGAPLVSKEHGDLQTCPRDAHVPPCHIGPGAGLLQK